MKIIEHEQGSAPWLRWRKSLLTATDAPVIVGVSPYCTPYKLWQRKLDLVEEQAINAAMTRGSNLEPEARAKFIAEYKINMTPKIVECSHYNFLGASLDGISDCYSYILEIKCNGKKTHDLVLKGEIPLYHQYQMQHQLLVTNAEKCFYYSYDGENGVCIEVFPDPNFIKDYLPRARAFWRSIVFFEPPSLCPEDFKDMKGSFCWSEYASQYQKLDTEIKSMECKKDYIRKKLIELCGDWNCAGYGIKVLKKVSKGRVDYESIPELQAIDIDKYRKDSSTSWTVLIDQR